MDKVIFSQFDEIDLEIVLDAIDMVKEDGYGSKTRNLAFVLSQLRVFDNEEEKDEYIDLLSLEELKYMLYEYCNKLP